MKSDVSINDYVSLRDEDLLTTGSFVLKAVKDKSKMSFDLSTTKDDVLNSLLFNKDNTSLVITYKYVSTGFKTSLSDNSAIVSDIFRCISDRTLPSSINTNGLTKNGINQPTLQGVGVETGVGSEFAVHVREFKDCFFDTTITTKIEARQVADTTGDVSIKLICDSTVDVRVIADVDTGDVIDSTSSKVQNIYLYDNDTSSDTISVSFIGKKDLSILDITNISMDGTLRFTTTNP